MFTIQGKHNTITVHTDNVESSAIAQMQELSNQEFTEGMTIAVMPDTHAGAGCVIGMTMCPKDGQWTKLVPNLVGVDIGCGMLACSYGNIEIDFEKLDQVIREKVPYGFSVHNADTQIKPLTILESLKCKDFVNLDRANKSIGTLGGGNHFIEINMDEFGRKYMVIHTGSRNLGLQVATYYQNKAIEHLKNRRSQNEEVINQLKQAGKEKEIESTLKSMQKDKIPEALAYVEGQDLKDYLHDMNIVQKYADFNRLAIAAAINKEMGWAVMGSNTTIHNYIDLENNILRKGAVSAEKDKTLLIPINMRDGSLLCNGKGNPNWNYSAPHGAGRLMSRSAAKEAISLDDFKESMQGVWSSCINQGTLDESPMAYKSMDEILENIKDTVEVIAILKPLYNFKASETEKTIDTKIDLLTERRYSDADLWFNEFTDELNKYLLPDWDKSFKKGYSYGSYLYQVQRGENHIGFRYPGATRGHISVDKNNVIQFIVFYNTAFKDESVACYLPEVEKGMQKFIGRKLVVKTE